MASENVTEQLRNMAKTEFDGLLAAVLSDVVDNQEKQTEVLNKLTKKIDTLQATQQQIEKNTEAIEELKRNTKIIGGLTGLLAALWATIQGWFIANQ